MLPAPSFDLHPYPFSQSYLDMQKRRRQHPCLQTDPWGEPVKVPEELWDGLLKKDLNLLGTLTLADTKTPGKIEFNFLNERFLMDLSSRIIYKNPANSPEPIDNPMLELVCLTYFKTVDRLYPMGKNLISSQDMKQALYFTGANKLSTEPVLRRFKDDPEELIRCAQCLGGKDAGLAHASAVLYPFPRLPLYYLLWNAEEDDPAKISILFDRSIESIFSPPLIWGLVNLVNSYLLSQ